MQITRTGQESIEIKTKQATLIAQNDNVTINGVALLGAGEYEVAGIEVFGIGDNIYTFRGEDITIAYLYNINRVLTEKEYAELTDASILILPLGEGKLDSKSAAQIIKAIEPATAIPLNTVETNEFCDTVGGCQEAIAQYKIVKSQLDAQEGQAVVLLTPLK